jgi:hypothetical protein
MQVTQNSSAYWLGKAENPGRFNHCCQLLLAFATKHSLYMHCIPSLLTFPYLVGLHALTLSSHYALFTF